MTPQPKHLTVRLVGAFAVLFAVSVALRLLLEIEVPLFVYSIAPAIWAAWGRDYDGRERWIAGATLAATWCVAWSSYFVAMSMFALGVGDLVKIVSEQLGFGIACGVGSVFWMWVANRPSKS